VALWNIDREFHLGLYRFAVRRYQPIIEKRAGVQLGSIEVKDIAELRNDIVATAEGRLHKGLIGLLCRWRARRVLPLIANRIVGSIPPGSSAVYSFRSIYVAFAWGMRIHEDRVIQITVHELAHRLWEKLGGRFPGIGWHRDTQSRELKMAVEGFAEYADRIWFRDDYPPSLQKMLAADRLNEASVYTQGMRTVDEAVANFGPAILLRLPTQWKRLLFP
jgi:hypothetical protein